jgi:hypothetical protein
VFTRIAPNGTRASATVTATASGTFSYSSTPPSYGTWTYSASYAGTAAISAATTTVHVTVNRLATTLSVAASAGTVNYRANVTVTAHLGATYKNRQVSVYAQTLTTKNWTLLKTATVSSSGNLAVTYAPAYSTTFAAAFTGDARYAPRTVTRTVSVRVAVSQVLSGYYASETYKGALYRIYHHTATLRDAITVAPNKRGECVKAQVQILQGGSWVNDFPVTSCGALSSTSRVPGSFGLGNAAGARYRIRALFYHSASDPRNVNNASSWLYFRVT